MLEAGDGVSDCLFISGKPPLVERYGKLQELPMEGPNPAMEAAHIEAIADLLIGDSERLRQDFTTTGSCDTSYALGQIARFVRPDRKIKRRCIDDDETVAAISNVDLEGS